MPAVPILVARRRMYSTRQVSCLIDGDRGGLAGLALPGWNTEPMGELWAKRTETGWTLTIRAQPSSGRSSVVGTVGDALKIRVAAPANEGKANAELLRFLATTLELRRNSVSLLHGERSRDKVVEVRGDADISKLSTD